MSRRILVTGGSGFIGSALVKSLVERGDQVRVLDDNSRGAPRRLAAVASDVEFVAGDVRDPQAVLAATQGADVVAHLAFVNGTEFFYSKPALVLDVGVRGALNTLDAALSCDVSEYWYMSSSEVYQTPPVVPTDESVGLSIPDPLNPRYSYGGGKLISELLAINYGRDRFDRTVIVRPHNVYGPDMGWEHVIPQFALRMDDAQAEHPVGRVPFPIQGDGSQTRAFCYIDDFVDGALLSFTEGEQLGIYHVGTSEERTIRDVAELVAAAYGREVDVLPGPEPAGATNRRCPDISKVSALGYQPKHDLAEGIRKTVEWYAENRDLQPDRS